MGRDPVLRVVSLVVLVIGIIAVATMLSGCGSNHKVQSVSGVPMAESGKIATDDKHHTVEQANIIERIRQDNSPGSEKHLYVISAYSGQVLLYSTVRGKVTSSDKRLSPKSISGVGYNTNYMPQIKLGSENYTVNELPGEDGTFGHSAEYLFWFTPDGRYHQHYLGGGQIVHISDRPVSFKGVVITTETTAKP